MDSTVKRSGFRDGFRCDEQSTFVQSPNEESESVKCAA